VLRLPLLRPTRRLEFLGRVLQWERHGDWDKRHSPHSVIQSDTKNATPDGLPQPHGAPRVSIVIPNWNGAELLTSISMPALAGQTFPDHRTVVVDNASTDDSQERLAADWPEAEFIQLDQNYGFAGAVNRGIKATESEYVAVVATDVAPDESWLAELVAALDEHQEAGSATGKVLRYEHRRTISSAGTFLKRSAVPDARGKGELDEGQYETPENVFGPDGGTALFRRAALEAVGGFDEDFFAYNEDVDWAFRAGRTGFTCRYVPSALAYHVGSATSKKVPGLFTYLMIRNSWWFGVKNLPPRLLLMLALYLMRRSWSAVRQGSPRPVFRAWASAATGTPRMLRKRSAAQKRRSA
jgi:GT2 family glycosyltransferase